jgi:endonuclease YncB( thermonuclease family)
MLKVRLWGIDAPELAQPYGTSATLELRRLTATTTFTLQVRSRDRYGRTVAILTLPDGRRVNTLMVQSGAAWWYRQYARKAADLMAAEVQARADHRGLWRDPDPTPPWTFRAAQRATTRKR